MTRVMDSKSRQVTDPIRNFKFLVNINHKSLGANPPGLHQAETRNGPNMAQLGFMNMSGLSASTDPIPYREGGDNTTQRKMPGQTNFADVTLSRGVVVGTWQSWYWLRELFFTHQGQGINRAPGQHRTEDFRADVEVMVLNHPYTSQNPNTLLKFEIFNAWPTVLAYSELDAGGNAVFIEQITLTHEGFDMKWAKSYQDDAWSK